MAQGANVNACDQDGSVPLSLALAYKSSATPAVVESFVSNFETRETRETPSRQHGTTADRVIAAQHFATLCVIRE